MRLLAAALSALKNALLCTLEGAWALLCWPLRVLAPPQGRSAIPAPPASSGNGRAAAAALTHADVVRADRAGAEALLDATRTGTMQDVGASFEAAKILGWAARSAAGGQAPEFPQGLPLRTAAWAKNLSPREIGSLARAGIAGVSAHLSGQSAIDGVPTVTSLTTQDRPQSPIPTAVRVKRQPPRSPQARPAAEGSDWPAPLPAPQFAPLAR